MLPLSNLSYYGDQANIGGATGFENKYYVDGIEVTDPLFQRDGTALPYNFIQEVEAKAGGYEADTRSALGGVLNVVTRSGTDQFHGSAFGFYTSNRFAGNRQIGLSDPTQGGFSIYDVGMSLGGPIVLGKLWFFVAYNPTFARRDVDVPGYGISMDKTMVNSIASKLTWKPSDRLRLALTMTGDPSMQNAVGRNVSVPPIQLRNSDPYFMDLRYGGVNISVAGTYTVGERVLLDASIARVNRDDTGDPVTQRGKDEPRFADHQDAGELWSGGAGIGWDAFRHATMGRLAATVTAGAHSMNAGVEYKVNGTVNSWWAHSIDKYSDTFYREGIYKADQTVHDKIPSLFVQDAWQISRQLNLRAGIRWDGQEIVGSNGKVMQKVTVPLQPRVGFTYVLGETGMHKLFGSYGRFSQELSLFWPVNTFSDRGYGYNYFYHQDPRIAGTVADSVQGGPFRISPGVPGLRGQYYDEFTLGYERSLDAGIRLRVDGIFRMLREVIDDMYDESTSSWRVGNPGRGLLAAWPRPQRDYYAVALTVSRLNDSHFNFLGSVVLSRNYGNYPGAFEAAWHGEFPNQSMAFDDLSTTKSLGKGLLPNDRTWVVKLAGSYRFDFGLSTGVFFVEQTGTPLSEYAALNNTWITSLVARRGAAGRTLALWDLSARLAYELPHGSFMPARIVLDLFHIASRKSAVDIQQWHGHTDATGQFDYVDPTYGKAFRYQPPMSARLGMEVSF